MDQSTNMNVTRAVQNSSDVPWEEDLDDILNILGEDILDSHAPVSQTAFGNKLRHIHDSTTPPTLPYYHHQEEIQPQCVGDVQRTFHSGVTVQSDFPVFPVTEHMDIDLTASSEVACYVPNANVTDRFNQTIDLASTQNSPHFMKHVVPGREASSRKNSFSSKHSTRKKQGKRQVQYLGREEAGKQPNGPIQHSPNKLFGILSLILQAFNSPLTAELEECYTGVLQRALAEIQEAVTLYKTLIDSNKSNEC